MCMNVMKKISSWNCHIAERNGYNKQRNFVQAKDLNCLGLHFDRHLESEFLA